MSGRNCNKIDRNHKMAILPSHIGNATDTEKSIATSLFILQSSHFRCFSDLCLAEKLTFLMSHFSENSYLFLSDITILANRISLSLWIISCFRSALFRHYLTIYHRESLQFNNAWVWQIPRQPHSLLEHHLYAQANSIPGEISPLDWKYSFIMLYIMLYNYNNGLLVMSVTSLMTGDSNLAYTIY